MINVSSAFLAEVARSHTATTKVELWSNNQLVRTVNPLSGSVEIDARRAVRRSASMTLIDYDGTLNPNVAGSVLTPFGNEVRIYRGVVYSNGTTEYAALGVFRIVGVRVSLTDNGVKLDVQMEDRAHVVQLAGYSSPYVVGTGNDAVAEATNLVLSRYKGVSYNVLDTPYFTPTTAKVLGVDGATDPWSDVLSIVEASGQEAFFDENGVFRTKNIPRLSQGTASATFAEGTSGTLISVSHDVATANIFNGITAHAEGTHLSVPLESTVWDNDAASPTRRTGPLGERPSDWSSSWVLTQTQLDDVANALLDTVRGYPVSIEVIPNPAIDVRDFIRVTSDTVGIDTLVMVDTITIPFGSTETMTITGRMRGY